MTDIVERLRTFDAWKKGVRRHKLVHDAADEIEKLRASLQAFVAFHSGHVLPPELVNAMLQARKALGDD